LLTHRLGACVTHPAISHYMYVCTHSQTLTCTTHHTHAQTHTHTYTRTQTQEVAGRWKSVGRPLSKDTTGETREVCRKCKPSALSPQPSKYETCQRCVDFFSCVEKVDTLATHTCVLDCKTLFQWCLLAVSCTSGSIVRITH
jgi:hypothetical protein